MENGEREKYKAIVNSILLIMSVIDNRPTNKIYSRHENNAYFVVRASFSNNR